MVTSLTNYAMPLIRYRIGDVASWADAPCSCGRGWPLLRSIQGRVSDTFVTTGGDLVPGQYFDYAFFLQDWVEKYQVVQEAPDRIRAIVVLRQDAFGTDETRADGMAEIARKTRAVMGDQCRVEFEFVHDIEPSPSGKYRYTISKVAASDAIAMSTKAIGQRRRDS